MRQPKTILVTCLLVVLIVFFSRCFQQNTSGNDPRGRQYAGTQVCMSCHKDVFTSYTHSNHYKTSSAINNDSLRKIIATAADHFYFTDSSYIHMEEKNGAFFQSNFADGKEVMSARFDVAFGSGEKAQTFAYWQGDKVMELPLTYFAGIRGWANSPGYSARHASYDRVIESQCFECHGSFIGRQFVQSGALKVEEKLDRSSVIYGIDCERCHGPAAEHVDYQTEHPSEKKAMYMTSIKSLSRQQQLDVCANCHSGNDKAAMKSLFAFRPGDTLSNYYYPDFESNNKEPDVHGRQLQLLRASICFQRSTMTCNTCHNAHESEKDQTAKFISKCMDCHHQSVHAQDMLKAKPKITSSSLVAVNCIDCHMPLMQSKIISFNSEAGLKNIPYFLRTHRIAIYKQQD
ncbi:MAG: multiheme c-type cytochrome [Chitinophagaceae bacterium]